MRRILVLAPHPDDEVVGCAVALRRAMAEGASARILFLTTGIPAREVLWPWTRVRHTELVERRREEAVRAAELLGAAIAGFQDWPTRTLKDHIPAAERLVRAAAHRATEVWAPAWEGAHQDHDVANWIAGRLSLPVKEFAEYSFFDGAVRSNSFPGGDGSIPLTPEEQAWKRRLLSVYASERGNLRHMRVEREALRPLPPHDYARPPHEGRLFYQRFQWLPFRHPRIDFTQPRDVCRALETASPISTPGRRHSASAERGSKGRPAPRRRRRPNGDAVR